MSERSRSTPSVAGEAAQPDERVPERSGPDLERFKVAVAAFLSAEGEERTALAGEIVDGLIAMRAPGSDEAESALVLKALDLRSFGTLVDARGRNGRKEAVETLLAMGYPHALKLSPEDLEFARTYREGAYLTAQLSLLRAVYKFYALTGAGLVANTVSHWGLSRVDDWFVRASWLAAAFALVASIGLARRPSIPPTLKLLYCVMLLTLPFSASMQWFLHSPSAWMGFAASVVGLIAPFRLVRQVDEDERWRDPDGK